MLKNFYSTDVTSMADHGYQRENSNIYKLVERLCLKKIIKNAIFKQYNKIWIDQYLISPKFIFFGISGVGITAGGVAAWQLTKRAKPVTLSAQALEHLSESSENNHSQEGGSWLDNDEVKKTCGSFAWTHEFSDSITNEMGKNWTEYQACLIDNKKYPQTPTN